MPCLRSPGLSWTCCEEKRPFFLKMSFTQNKAIEIAIINTLRIKVSIIFINFVATKVMQIKQSAK